MSLTVITVSKASQALRGDLTKWMQEVATGVYVGRFSARIRQELWKRVQVSIKSGEATLTYQTNNELGYRVETLNTHREMIDFEGLELVFLPKKSNVSSTQLGFSKAAKFRKARKYADRSKRTTDQSYVIIDIETDGLNSQKNQIIELGAIRIRPDRCEWFSSLLMYEGGLPEEIVSLTGITDELLAKKGQPFEVAIREFHEFIGDDDLVGYNLKFDLSFLNRKLREYSLPPLTNKKIDLLRMIKKEHPFLDNYQLSSVLSVYQITDRVKHRALEDCKVTAQLAMKVIK